MNGNDHISPDDLALHALQALSPEESTAVRAHLHTCAQCSDQFLQFRDDAALIGLSVDRHPVPPGARDRFLRRISSDGAASPANIPPVPAMPVSAVPVSASSVSAASVLAAQITAAPPREKVVVIRRTPWLAWSAAAVLAIASVLLGLRVDQLNTQMQNTSAQYDAKLAGLTTTTAKARQVLDLLTSHSAQHVLLTAARTAPLPTGRAVYLAASGGLVFQASDLKQISADKTYELWVIPATGKPIPAGLFRPDATGSATVVLPQLPANTPAKAFGVTIEIASGSDTPTAPLVMAGAPGTGE